MGQTITFRPTKKLAEWIEQAAARIGVSQGQLIREQLERARTADRSSKKFMRLAGIIRGGPRDLSTKKVLQDSVKHRRYRLSRSFRGKPRHAP